MKNRTMKYPYRYVARITVEAATPLKVGSGLSNLTSDAPVLRDVNGLPYVPGTALAGVLRHSVAAGATPEQLRRMDAVFGFQKGTEGCGSCLICSAAYMVGRDGHTVLEGLRPEVDTDPFYRAFREELPVRQHVRIDRRGTAEQGGKFDEEVVFKGTRFVFEVELLGETAEDAAFFHTNLLPKMYYAGFRLGGGSRKGFGEVHIVSLLERTYQLGEAADLTAYLAKSSSLNAPFEGATEVGQTVQPDQSGWTQYVLTLRPRDFLLFSSGLKDEEVDMTPVRERVVVYDPTAHFTEERVLIPASSVKGALVHRVAFHYNRLTQQFAETMAPESADAPNRAVQQLFGVTAQGNRTAVRGHVLFSDVLQETAASEKVLNHVTIDRFTGGAIEGALFAEKALYFPNDKEENTFRLTLLVADEALAEPTVREAWEAALSDLCDGYLALGGGTNRGHGLFEGTCAIIKSDSHGA